MCVFPPFCPCPYASSLPFDHRAGGYLPSSNAADDYLAQLKADSKKKHKEQQAILNGLPLPPAEENSPATTTATGPAAVAPYEAAAPSQV